MVVNSLTFAAVDETEEAAGAHDDCTLGGIEIWGLMGRKSTIELVDSEFRR